MARLIASVCLWSILPLIAWAQDQEQFLVVAQTPQVAEKSRLYPAALIDVAPRYRYAFIAELVPGKLHVYERGVDGLMAWVKTIEMSIGKEGYGKQIEGDNKTPVGVYRIISHLTNEQLDDFYGHAAYPVNYPNVWDRLHQRTGYGIWLHAEPVGFLEKTRPLLDSNGCVVVSNNDIDNLHQYVNIGHTYIVMTPTLELSPAEKVLETRSALYQQLAAWEQAWESLQSEPYLAFYSDDFNNMEKNKAQWDSYKKRVNGGKRFIDVGFSDVGIYQYPGESNTVWVEFYQSYRSSNYNSTGWKRQLWKLEDDNQWRIIYEGGG